MNWTIRFIIAILLTSLTGTILYAVWYGIGTILERMGYVNIMYWLLRLLLVFWFIPIAYITIALDIDLRTNGGSFLFFNTKTIVFASEVLVGIWGLVVLCNCGKYIGDICKMNLHLRSNFECDVEMRAFFDDICEMLSIKKGRVQVRQSLMTPIPVCVGTFRPTVIIPSGDYTKEQLMVIFIHELVHYKHKDQWFKHLIFIASCVHCFNPVIYRLRKKARIWAEYACDDEAVCFAESQKEYFRVIIELAESGAKMAGLYSTMVEEDPEIQSRIECVQRSKDMVIKNKWKALLCVVTMFVASTSSVYGATRVTEQAYLNTYDATVEDVSELSQTVTADGLVEYEVAGLDDGVTEVEDQVFGRDRSGSSYTFGWEVPKKYSKRSAGFSASSGEEITVTAIATPSNVTYHYGIVQPDGVRRYVSGTNVLTHKFSLTQTGTYYVYVQNMSTTTGINVSGAYRVQ